MKNSARNFRWFVAVISVFASLSTPSAADAASSLCSGPQSVADVLGLSASEQRKHRVHVLIRADRGLTSKQRKQLRKKDVVIVQSVEAGYIAVAPSHLLSKGEGSLGLVVGGEQYAIDDFTTRGKIEERIRTDKLFPWARDANGRIRVLVQYFSDVDSERISKELESMGLQGEPYGVTTWKLTATKGDLESLAKCDSVRRIEQGPLRPQPIELKRIPAPAAEASGAGLAIGAEEEPSDSELEAEAESEPLGETPARGLAVSPEVRLGVCDTGVDELHVDFEDALQLPRFYRSWWGISEHGTFVAAIMSGAQLVDGVGIHRGYAPDVAIGDYDWFQADAEKYYKAIVCDETDATNHSYTQTDERGYIALVADIDSIIRGDHTYEAEPIPARPQVWAAGNLGTTRLEAEAKNAIVVGSINRKSCGLSSSACDVSSVSSHGFTPDGRIKPDLVAPGCDSEVEPIFAALSGTKSLHVGFSCETSYATPAVTGTVGLVMAQLDANPGFRFAYSATYKALLVHTAIDQVGAAPIVAGPDTPTGWGLLAVDAAVLQSADPTRWRESEIVQTDESDEYCVDVSDAGVPIKVTLAWDDLPGSTCGSGDPNTLTEQQCREAAKLVNDLDLVLVAPDKSEVHSVTADQTTVPATPDRKNNVEMAIRAAPAAGLWRIRIDGYDIKEPQPYGLSASHPILEICPSSTSCGADSFSCDLLREPPRRIRPTDGNVIDITRPVLLTDVCRSAVQCPICSASAGKGCKSLRLTISDVRSNTIVSVLSERGKVVARDQSRRSTRRLTFRRQAGERYLIVASDRKGQLLKQPANVQFGMRR